MTTDFEHSAPRRVHAERRMASIAAGSVVLHGDALHLVKDVVNLEQIDCVDLESGQRSILNRTELSLALNSESASLESPDLAAISPKQWKIAKRRYAAIEPLLREDGSAAVEKRALDTKISKSSLYRWLGRFRAYGNLVGLIPKSAGWPSGRCRLDPVVRMLVDETIAKVYLTPQRLRTSHVVRQVKSACIKRNLPIPQYNAVARRIKLIPEEQRMRARGMREAAERKFKPVPGTFPNAEYPLAVVQIDHTPADVVLVDAVNRKPVGRPWLTIAMDVYSRAIVGYHLSFEAPSEATDGFCIAQAILPKEELLQTLEVSQRWPVYGLMRKIHSDNGADFRSNDFKKSCEAYAIDLEFRPVKRPRFGGNIERNFGSLNSMIHSLAGTTFSSPQERAEYNCDRYANLTIDEFEKILVEHICGVYHVSRHSAIGTTPLRKWEVGLLGEGGTGLPTVPTDEMRLRLDFLPSFKRTIQPTGVDFDCISYYSETLRSWIGASDPDDPKSKRQFVFRHDPRDVRTIWFYDPEAKCYFEIPSANRQLPRMSAWEAKRVRQRARQEGAKHVDEHTIVRTYENIEAQATKAARKTKAIRRKNESRQRNARTSIVGARVAAEEQKVAAAKIPFTLPVDDFVDDVEAFDQVW